MPENFILLGYAMSLLGIILGASLLFIFPYASIITEDNLFVRFVFLARSISLGRVSWYRYIGRRWRLNGRVTLFTLMRYTGENGSSRLILLGLESRELKGGWRTRNYTSELNSFIPERDRTRR